VKRASDALVIDLYELTMAASYHACGMGAQPATFELFFRELPPVRNYLIASGGDLALSYLETLAFSPEDLAALERLDLFPPAFLEVLSTLRFTGDVWAIPEGEAVFPTEPVLRVTGPLIESQIVETFLLNVINYSTAVASKAARVDIACRGRPFVDFSARRDHGPDAALLAARAAYIGGAAATSNVAAGACLGIPLSGTMAHSYVLAFPSEEAAFRAFLRSVPTGGVLLIDTYDTLAGARCAAAVAADLAASGVAVRGVRLDSGEIAGLSRGVREILDAAGQQAMEIFVSGDLDEYAIAVLLEAGAPIDGFGVGTQLGTVGDAPSLGGVYKLVETGSVGRAKASAGKQTLPGIKQVFRSERDGLMVRDLLCPAGDAPPPDARPLLMPVMAGGHRVAVPPALVEIRERCRRSVASLPEDPSGLRQRPALGGVEVDAARRSRTQPTGGRASPAPARRRRSSPA
jgi:nicotinate phosphoribosyltransferase